MITQHNVKMSPRMERLWKYIREERGISLTDFSTDECVERVQDQLLLGLKELEARVSASRGDRDRDLENLLVDYRTIMNRRPHARTTAAMQASEAAAIRARGIVAAARDEIVEQIKGR